MGHPVVGLGLSIEESAEFHQLMSLPDLSVELSRQILYIIVETGYLSKFSGATNHASSTLAMNV